MNEDLIAMTGPAATTRALTVRSQRSSGGATDHSRMRGGSDGIRSSLPWCTVAVHRPDRERPLRVSLTAPIARLRTMGSTRS
jgi:hypothetical protein